MTPEQRLEHDRELARRRNAKYRAAHPERLRAASKIRRDATREQRRQYNDKYRATHKEQARAYRESLDAPTVKAYLKAYNAAHPEQAKARKKAWHLAHRDENLARAKVYYATHQEEYRAYVTNNKDAIAKRRSEHKRANRARYTAHQIRREALKRLAVPAWADPVAIMAIYKEAERLSLEAGIQHDVDHVIPLRGRTVSGLHVQSNLQVLTHAENIRKHNKFSPMFGLVTVGARG